MMKVWLTCCIYVMTVQGQKRKANEKSESRAHVRKGDTFSVRLLRSNRVEQSLSMVQRTTNITDDDVAYNKNLYGMNRIEKIKESSSLPPLYSYPFPSTSTSPTDFPKKSISFALTPAFTLYFGPQKNYPNSLFSEDSTRVIEYVIERFIMDHLLDKRHPYFESFQSIDLIVSNQTFIPFRYERSGKPKRMRHARTRTNEQINEKNDRHSEGVNRILYNRSGSTGVTFSALLVFESDRFGKDDSLKNVEEGLRKWVQNSCQLEDETSGGALVQAFKDMGYSALVNQIQFISRTVSGNSTFSEDDIANSTNIQEKIDRNVSALDQTISVGIVIGIAFACVAFGVCTGYILVSYFHRCSQKSLSECENEFPTISTPTGNQQVKTNQCRQSTPDTDDDLSPYSQRSLNVVSSREHSFTSMGSDSTSSSFPQRKRKKQRKGNIVNNSILPSTSSFSSRSSSGVLMTIRENNGCQSSDDGSGTEKSSPNHFKNLPLERKIELIIGQSRIKTFVPREISFSSIKDEDSSFTQSDKIYQDDISTDSQTVEVRKQMNIMSDKIEQLPISPSFDSLSSGSAALAYIGEDNASVPSDDNSHHVLASTKSLVNPVNISIGSHHSFTDEESVCEDFMCGQSDEESLGNSAEVLDVPSTMIPLPVSFRQISPGAMELVVVVPKGEIGIVLDVSLSGKPCSVRSLRRDSNVWGKIFVGDSIVKVDQVDVSRLSAVEVSEIISKHSHDSECHITIRRPICHEYRNTNNDKNGGCERNDVLPVYSNLDPSACFIGGKTEGDVSSCQQESVNQNSNVRKRAFSDGDVYFTNVSKQITKSRNGSESMSLPPRARIRRIPEKNIRQSNHTISYKDEEINRGGKSNMSSEDKKIVDAVGYMI